MLPVPIEPDLLFFLTAEISSPRNLLMWGYFLILKPFLPRLL